ncbi:MAG: N-acetyltransferase family protein [Ilumatobacteraceae bacterium]
MVTIRDAVDDDIPAITAITNALLATTTYEWTEEPHTEASRGAWLAAHRVADHPVLVAVDDDDDGSVVGWAAYGDFRDTAKWPGYRPVVEHTIHVDAGQWGSDVARLLMAALVDRARVAGKRAMIGGIDGENERSIRFHRRLGFVEVARMPGIGEKFGRPLDLVLMQLDINE